MIGKALSRKLFQNKDYAASILFRIGLLFLNIWRKKQPAYNDGDEDAYLTKAVRLSVPFIPIVGSPNPFKRNRTLLI
jgi:hypothetical protein